MMMLASSKLGEWKEFVIMTCNNNQDELSESEIRQGKVRVGLIQGVNLLELDNGLLTINR